MFQLEWVRMEYNSLTKYVRYNGSIWTASFYSVRPADAKNSEQRYISEAYYRWFYIQMHLWRVTAVRLDAAMKIFDCHH